MTLCLKFAQSPDTALYHLAGMYIRKGSIDIEKEILHDSILQESQDKSSSQG
jgi:hypothetical protein